jgi:hypothetical protein
MEDPTVVKIKNKFDINGNPAKIPLMNENKSFTARSEEEGIYVDNLGNQPLLPWRIFSEAINCLKENGGQVKKGNAMDSRLGDSNLDLNTMEGYIANKVYGCKIGDSVFRRITPIASILSWAEICENTRGQIRLLPGGEFQEKNLEESISAKDRDLRALAGKEKKINDLEVKVNTLKVALITSEEKVKRLEKQLSGYIGEEKLAIQLREKEELIKQFKGTLASKEEEFSRLNEENRKFRMHQKFASEGLKQIEEQKASKKWWRRL